ncbi:MAG: hypothetical protein Q9218_003822 [Villophora microphyllina]
MSPSNILFFLYLCLFSAISYTSASPIDQPSLNQSSSSPNATTTRPPKKPICPAGLGHPTRMIFFGQYCANAIDQIPRDVRPSSPTRNFYLQNQDVNPRMPNHQLPLEWESGDCVVQLLLASSFRDVPHEQATWMDIWGSARTILQQCILPRIGGGIITHLGDNEKLDLVIFSKRSQYALTRRLQNSPDPVAKDIAEYEFLQLLGYAHDDFGEDGGNATETVGEDAVPTGDGQGTNAEGVVTA